MCGFCAIFAPNGMNSRQNRPETADFAGKMRFFVRLLQKKLAIVRKSRYNFPVTTKERVTQHRTSNQYTQP